MNTNCFGNKFRALAVALFTIVVRFETLGNMTVSSQTVVLGSNARGAIGVGFDSVLHERRESPFVVEMDGAENVGDTNVVGSLVTFDYKEIRHRLDVYQSLSGGLSGGVSWLGSSFAGGFSFRESSSQSASVYRLLAEVALKDRTVGATSILKLTPNASAILSRDPSAFIEIYGDHYVHSVRLGASFYVLVEIGSLQNMTYDEVKASINLRSTKVSIDGFIESVKNIDRSQYSVSIKMITTEWQRELPDVEEIGEYARKLPLDGSRSVIEYHLQPYSNSESVRMVTVTNAPDVWRGSARRARAASQLAEQLRKLDLRIEDNESILKYVEVNGNVGGQVDRVRGMLRYDRELKRIKNDVERMISLVSGGVDSVYLDVDRIVGEVYKMEAPYGAKVVRLSQGVASSGAPVRQTGTWVKRHSEGGDADWGVSPIRVIAKVQIARVGDGSKRMASVVAGFDVQGDWNKGREHRIFGAKAGEVEVMNLPVADMYLLPNGRESLTEEYSTPEGHSPHGFVSSAGSIGGGPVLVGEVKYAESVVTMEYKPLRILCIDWIGDEGEKGRTVGDL